MKKILFVFALVFLSVFSLSLASAYYYGDYYSSTVKSSPDYHYEKVVHYDDYGSSTYVKKINYDDYPRYGSFRPYYHSGFYPAYNNYYYPNYRYNGYTYNRYYDNDLSDYFHYGYEPPTYIVRNTYRSYY